MTNDTLAWNSIFPVQATESFSITSSSDVLSADSPVLQTDSSVPRSVFHVLTTVFADLPEDT